MLKAICASVLLLLMGAPWAAAENRALIVGVGKYRTPGNDLPGIENDVARMTEVAQRMGFTSSQIKVLLDSQATFDNITQALQTWLVDGVTAQDKVLFYFSGHGSYVRDASGDEPDGTDEVILPTDVRVADRTLENALLDDDLGVLLDRLPTRNVYVFLDACHSGTATRSLGGGDYVPKFFTYPGMPSPKQVIGAARGLDARKGTATETHVVLTAATEHEQAQAGKQGSVFTYAVLEVVNHAAKENLPLTPKDLRDFANQFISTVFAERPALIHHPTVHGDAALLGKSILEGSSAAASAPAAPAAPPQVATVNPAPPPAAAATPAPAPAPAAAPGAVWTQLASVAKRAAYPVRVSASKAAYQVGEQLVLDVEVASDGYLNVLNVGAGDDVAVVLYPNKYNPDNTVKAGQKITIPAAGAPYSIPAGLPPGQSEQHQLILVLHTKKKLSAYEAGAGDGFLRALSGPATRSFSVVASAPEAGGFGVGQALVVIRK